VQGGEHGRGERAGAQAAERGDRGAQLVEPARAAQAGVQVPHHGAVPGRRERTFQVVGQRGEHVLARPRSSSSPSLHAHVT
jgi:hypothetical protein